MVDEETQSDGEPSALERLLSVFTDVEAGEGVTALLLTANIFLLLTAYYVIKPVREALILVMKSGAQYKSYMSGAIAIALLVAVPIYAGFARKLPRNNLVVGVTLFFISHLVVFYALSNLQVVQKSIGLVFFLWVGIFNMMVVAQFWAFANDIYTEEQGERLFALIGIGASTGAAAGSAVSKFLIPVLGVYQMLLLCGAILGVCAFITQVVHVRESKPKRRKKIKSQLENTMSASAEEMKEAMKKLQQEIATKKEEKAAGEPKEESGSFSTVFRYRYLILMAVFSLLFTFINTNGEYILSAVVSDAAKEQVASGAITASERKEWIGAWYGDFFLVVNILGVLLQSFAVSRIVKYGGIRLALFIFPVAALLDAAALVVAPILLTARIGKTFENASDYSVNNTARNMLWLPTTRAMKYQAKQAVDTFFVRMGDVSSAVLVYILAGVFALGVRSFALTNLILVAMLLVVCTLILREQKNIKAMKERGELPE